jgi:hypothetical protein
MNKPAASAIKKAIKMLEAADPVEAVSAKLSSEILPFISA